MGTNIDVNAINNLIAGKTSIKVGIDMTSLLLLIAGVFLAVLFGVVVAKLLTA